MLGFLILIIEADEAAQGIRGEDVGARIGDGGGRKSSGLALALMVTKVEERGLRTGESECAETTGGRIGLRKVTTRCSGRDEEVLHACLSAGSGRRLSTLSSGPTEREGFEIRCRDGRRRFGAEEGVAGTRIVPGEGAIRARA